MSRLRTNSHRKSAWWRRLRDNLSETPGYCRMCGDRYRIARVDRAGLRLAHLAPQVVTGLAASRETCTLACRRCDEAMGARDWTGAAPSLLEQPNPQWKPDDPPFRWGRDGTMRTSWVSSGPRTITTTLGDLWDRTADGWARRFG